MYTKIFIIAFIMVIINIVIIQWYNNKNDLTQFDMTKVSKTFNDKMKPIIVSSIIVFFLAILTYVL